MSFEALHIVNRRELLPSITDKVYHTVWRMAAITRNRACLLFHSLEDRWDSFGVLVQLLNPLERAYFKISGNNEIIEIMVFGALLRFLR